MKHLKESILSNETANQDIENTAKNVKRSEYVTEVIKEMEKKLLEVISTVFHGIFEVINRTNEIIAVLKIYEKKIILVTAHKNEVFY